MRKLIIPLIVVLLLVSGCNLTGGAGCGTKLPTINTFNASPSPVSPGATAMLSWNVSGATTIAINQGIGNVALAGSRTVTPAATTVYILTATNAAGSVTATTEVAVSAAVATPSAPVPIPTPPAPEPAPVTPSLGLPVINYFTASPPFISSGGTTTLSWGASNATTVTIDQGIGNVGLVGTAPASPAVTTNYTLTASNPAGWYSVTITVGVGAPPPPADKPDLVITDILRSGSTISYIIKNQGTATAGPSTSQFVVDGVVKATDAVGPLSAGASSTESFSFSYTCSGTSDSVAVQADISSVVTESDEGNNARSESWSCLILAPMPPLIPILLKPDLVITDIWRDGSTIRYRIKNQGNADAVPSTTRLIVDGTVKGHDSVPALPVGAESPQSFPLYILPMLPFHTFHVTVRADQANAVNEYDETNNERTENVHW